MIVLQYIQVRLPLYSLKSLEPEDLVWSEGPLFWWWEVKVALIYAACTCSLYCYCRRSLDSSTPRDVESGVTHDNEELSVIPQDMECPRAQDGDRTRYFNTRALLNLLLQYRRFVAHLLTRLSRSQAPNNLTLQPSILPDQLGHQFALPDQLGHQFALPYELGHQSVLPDQLGHQSALPDQLGHQSALPDQLEHQFALPDQLGHQSALPDQLGHHSTLLQAFASPVPTEAPPANSALQMV
nr:uncharacterized protein LOC128703591 [Cherax quadricarinatus]